MKTIELTPNQNSTFDTDIGGKRYTFIFTYNGRTPAWIVELSLGGVTLLSGVSAVIGVELFQGDANLDVPRNLFIIPIDESSKDANFSGLGVRVKFVEIEPEDDINVPAI